MNHADFCVTLISQFGFVRRLSRLLFLRQSDTIGSIFLHPTYLLCPRLLGSFVNARGRTGLSHRWQAITIPARGAWGEFRCDLHCSCAIRVMLAKLAEMIVHSQGHDVIPNFTHQHTSRGKSPNTREREEVTPSHLTLFSNRQLLADQRKSGGVASALSNSIASARVITRCCCSPSVRIATVPSSASRLPTTSRCGTLASECSRTL